MFVRVFAVFALWLATAAQGAAQGDVRLRVGVIERPPFAIRTDDGAWLGMAVDLWRLAAEDLGLSYAYVDLDAGAVAAALEAGDVDVALPVNATPGLEQAVDLTHPVYTATLGVAAKRQSQVLSVVRGFLSWQFLRLVLALSVLLLAVGALIWLVERRRNPEQFHSSALRGLGDGFWWAGVTLTTIGYGDKAPATFAGRTVAMLWMLVGLAVSAALTAAVVTLAGVDRQVDVPETFSGRSVGAVEGTTTAVFLQGKDVALELFGSVETALTALDGGEVDTVAAAAPVLRHAISASGTLDMGVRTTGLDPHLVALAVRSGSTLLEPLNVALLERLSSESGWNLTERYLPN